MISIWARLTQIAVGLMADTACVYTLYLPSAYHHSSQTLIEALLTGDPF